jgi:hypothetical protein
MGRESRELVLQTLRRLVDACGRNSTLDAAAMQRLDAAGSEFMSNWQLLKSASCVYLDLARCM